MSAAGTLRGIHFAQLPPSQAKYVTCLDGRRARRRRRHPGRLADVELDAERRGIYLSEGSGTRSWRSRTDRGSTCARRLRPRSGARGPPAGRADRDRVATQGAAAAHALLSGRTSRRRRRPGRRPAAHDDEAAEFVGAAGADRSADPVSHPGGAADGQTREGATASSRATMSRTTAAPTLVEAEACPRACSCRTYEVRAFLFGEFAGSVARVTRSARSTSVLRTSEALRLCRTQAPDERHQEEQRRRRRRRASGRSRPARAESGSATCRAARRRTWSAR